MITDWGVRTIRNWPVIKIFSVRTIWIANKLPNSYEEKKNSISKRLIDSREYLRYQDIEKIEISKRLQILLEFLLFSAQISGFSAFIENH